MHPNLLHLIRACAKWRGGTLLIATLFAVLAVGAFAAPGNGGMARRSLRGDSPTPNLPPPADSLPLPPGPIIVGKKGVVVAGDTLVYTISWGPGARASSYDVTRSVSASNGTWTVVADSQSGGAKNTGSLALPNTFSYTRTTLSHRMWLAAVPWDSATFTVTVVSRNAIGVSSPVSTSWKVSRKPGSPGPIVVDSSLIPVGILIQPKPFGVFIGSSRIECAFSTFANGAVAQHTADKPSCDSIYVKYVPVAARTLVNAAQQAYTDSTSKTCVTWRTDAPLTAMTLAPMATCSAAVRVTGVGLTRRFPADAIRYASARP